MENHPIPQDITGFQFKLIGNMTIKQFIYLAVGAFFAWVFFFLLGLPSIIKFPLSVISFALGAMIAFVPIDGRPMDVMIANFIKALISPTQFLYQKEGFRLSEAKTGPAHIAPVVSAPIIKHAANPIVTRQSIQTAPVSSTQSNPIVTPAPVSITQVNPTVAQSAIQTAAQPIQQMPTIPIQLPTPQAHPVIQELDDHDEANKAKEEIQKANMEKLSLEGHVVELKKELEVKNAEQHAPQETAAPQPVQPQPTMQTQQQQSQQQINLEKELEEARRQREALERELLTLKAQAQTAAQPTFNPVIAKPVLPTQRVRQVPQGMEKSAGLPAMPEAPNLITGIIKDPRGNPLPNMLVEVKDQDSNPVRAFKTNALGRFASATSLSNGKYLITFEDPKEQHKFDAVQMEMQGAPVMPLEIISVDPREELRRELFN